MMEEGEESCFNWPNCSTNQEVIIEGFSQNLHSANRRKASLEKPPFLKSQNFNYGATVLLLILPSIRELIFSWQKNCSTVWSAFSPCLVQQATILKLRKSVWPSVFKDTGLFSLEENGCFYDNNWTLIFLMLLSDLDCSGLFLSKLCLCFVVSKYILNRVNLNQANTSHFIKYTVKYFNLCVVNFLLRSTRKT